MITVENTSKKCPLTVRVDESCIYVQYRSDEDDLRFDRSTSYSFDTYTRKMIEFLNKKDHRKIYLGMGIRDIVDTMMHIEILLGDQLKGAEEYDVVSEHAIYKVRHVGNNFIGIARISSNGSSHGYFQYTKEGKLCVFDRAPKSEEDLPVYKYEPYEDFLKYYGESKASEEIYEIISKKIDYSLGKSIFFQPPVEFCGLIDPKDINDALMEYIESMSKLLSPNIPAREVESDEVYFFRPTYEVLCEKSPIAMFGRAKYMDSFSKVHQVYSTSPAMLIKLADLYVLCMIVDSAFFKHWAPVSYKAIMLDHEPFATTLDRFRRFLIALSGLIEIIVKRHPLYFVFSVLALLNGHDAAEKVMKNREEMELKLALRGRKFGEK